MRVLVAAPFVGEIGWELMSWQGRVRRVFHSGRFERLVVLGAAGKAAFYADMPLEYRALDLSSLPGEAYEDRRIDPPSRRPLPTEVIRASMIPCVAAAERELCTAGEFVETLWPGYDGRIWPTDGRHQDFIRFGQASRPPVTQPCVMLVQRKRAFRAQDNWSSGNWRALADCLEARGIQVRVYPNDAEAAIELLSACDLAVGQSTGGLHLAALCGCPAVVWSVDDTHLWTPLQMTNRQRYQTLWNPLGTPVEYHAVGGGPAPEAVAEWTAQALQRIGRRAGCGLAAAGFRLQWRARTFIDRVIVRRPGFGRWPWPVQRFVRYALV